MGASWLELPDFETMLRLVATSQPGAVRGDSTRLVVAEWPMGRIDPGDEPERPDASGALRIAAEGWILESFDVDLMFCHP